ncbi:MAG: NADH-quinone oxidoreductase subunit C [Saprospiraceae bacterium]|nr:NADH-quinone oxidoreductase subunit C [Saprospiraceae bacterium]
MESEQILGRLAETMPGAVTAHDTALDGILNIHTTREKLYPLLQTLRDDEQLGFNFLTSLCAIHYPENAGQELGMIYHLHNWAKNVRIRVKIYFPKEDAHVPTVSTLWPSANWQERQEYDFFGVVFTGHPDLRRILNVDDMEVFPMRKEYRLEDGTRTDKDDRFFGREGHEGRSFD